MIIKHEKLKISITELLLLALSVVFLIGAHSWFAVCPVSSDMPMSCHWAGQMLKVLAVLFAVVSVIHILIADGKIKLGMDIPFIGISLVAAFIPGKIIPICQSADMACRQGTQTWTIIICIALILVLLGDIILYASRISAEKHARKGNL